MTPYSSRILCKSAAAAMLVMVMGCGSAPSITQLPPPDIDLPGNWTAEQPDTEQATQVDALWWRGFNDTALDTLITTALTHSFTLEAAAARIDQAGALARIAGADLPPHLSGGFNASRRKQNFIGLPIPGGEGEVLSTMTNSYGVSLETTWELDLWGRIRSGKSAALADLQAAHADFAGARLSLIGQIGKAWFAAIEAGQQMALAEETVASYRQSKEQVQERFNLGVRTSLDLRLARTQLAQAQALLELRRQQQDRITRQLEVLLGRYPKGALTATVQLPEGLPPVPAGLPATLLGRRPDLVSAERRLAAADKRTAQAKRALYPRLSLTASTGSASQDLENLVDGDFSVWSVVGNIVAPLFQGGRLRGNVALNRSRAEESLALFADAMLRAFGEVENALVAEGHLINRERHLAEAAEQSQAARVVAEEQYRRGLVDYITVLESQRQALTARSSLITVRRERMDARIDLHLVLGGGFTLRNIPKLTPTPDPSAQETSS